MIKLFLVEYPGDYPFFVPFHNIACIRKIKEHNKTITHVFLKYGVGDGNIKLLKCTNEFEVLTKQITEDLRDKKF